MNHTTKCLNEHLQKLYGRKRKMCAETYMARFLHAGIKCKKLNEDLLEVMEDVDTQHIDGEFCVLLTEKHARTSLSCGWFHVRYSLDHNRFLFGAPIKNKAHVKLKEPNSLEQNFDWKIWNTEHRKLVHVRQIGRYDLKAEYCDKEAKPSRYVLYI